MIDLIVMILTLLVGVVNWHNDPEKKAKRIEYEENKDIIEGNSKKLSVRLSDAFDGMCRKDKDS